MRREELEKRVGTVVILDLVSGLEIVTEVKRMDIDGYAITSAPWLIFQADLRAKNPMARPSEDNPVGWHVSHGEYGNPVFKVDDDKPIHYDHIICAHDCPKQLEAVYAKVSTGIEIADASVLQRLDAANKPQRR